MLEFFSALFLFLGDVFSIPVIFGLTIGQLIFTFCIIAILLWFFGLRVFGR